MKIQVQQTLHQLAEIVPSQKSLEDKILSNAFEAFKNQFDSTNGGFGRAPKFPSSMVLSFLLRYWKRANSKEALSIAEFSLEKMAHGGIFDHVGGGFHRYSVDDRWLIPHFEKMLYDNALLSRAYFEAYQVTRKKTYLHVGEEVLHYVLREMTSSEGGFYSTQDADSEGEEGKFYVWTRDQIKEILGKEKGTVFCAYHGVIPQGNFERGTSVLHIASTFEKVCELYGIPIPDLEKIIQEGRRILLIEREKRVRPARDEKILASWNGLMISSFVDGYKVTANETYLDRAKKTAHFIIDEMGKDRHLKRVFNKGKAKIKGYSEDYAFFIQALIDLYEATFELEWLKEADDFNKRMIDEFWDDKNGGFFFTGKGDESLITRSKNPYDHAIPSSNSVSLFNLIRLGYLTGEESFKQKAEQVLHLFLSFLSEHPSGFPHMLSGLSFFLDPEEIGIIGSKSNLRTKSMIQEIYRTYLPNKILSLRDPQMPIEGSWFPFLKDKNSEKIPAAFVCKKFVCLPPAKNEKALRKILE